MFCKAKSIKSFGTKSSIRYHHHNPHKTYTNTLFSDELMIDRYSRHNNKRNPFCLYELDGSVIRLGYGTEYHEQPSGSWAIVHPLYISSITRGGIIEYYNVNEECIVKKYVE